MSGSIALLTEERIRPGLPKKAESFFLFEINKVDDFQRELNKLVPLITTGERVLSSKEAIRQHRKSNSSLLPTAFLNIAFSAKGLEKVGYSYFGPLLAESGSYEAGRG